MKKLVTFFSDPNWAFGRIHSDLIKYLFNLNINATLTSWEYSISNISKKFFESCDAIVCPVGATPCIQVGYIPIEKTCIVFHGLVDINQLYNSKLDLRKFKKVGAVSSFLQSEVAKVFNMPLSDIYNLRIGIDLQQFNWCNISQNLNTIGYAGAYAEDDTEEYLNSLEYNSRIYRQEIKSIKRAYLVKEITEDTNLHYLIACKLDLPYTAMGAFYDSIDCLICPSLHEGAGMPILEASAAGKLILGTAVGHWNDYDCLGHVLPLDPYQLKQEAISILEFYKNNPDKYVKKCKEIKEYSIKYCWTNHIKDWANFIY